MYYVLASTSLGPRGIFQSIDPFVRISLPLIIPWRSSSNKLERGYLFSFQMTTDVAVKGASDGCGLRIDTTEIRCLEICTQRKTHSVNLPRPTSAPSERYQLYYAS